MNEWLTKLGIPADVQALFGISTEVFFDYGDGMEYFGPGLLKVPVSAHIWTCGNSLASEWLITWSASEAMAMLTYHRNAFQNYQNLFILSLGCAITPKSLGWIHRHCHKRKVSLIFPNDLTGRATDIIIAAALKNKSVMLSWQKSGVKFECNDKQFFMDCDRISLAAFERHAGIRSKARSLKPKHCNTFLEQLSNEYR